MGVVDERISHLALLEPGEEEYAGFLSVMLQRIEQIQRRHVCRNQVSYFQLRKIGLGDGGHVRSHLCADPAGVGNEAQLGHRRRQLMHQREALPQVNRHIDDAKRTFVLLDNLVVRDAEGRCDRCFPE